MAKRMGLIHEMVLFLKENKAYWMVPILIILLLLIAVVVVGAIGGGAAAPFIYTLF